MSETCTFAACDNTASVLVTLRSECGHTHRADVPVCSKHSTPGQSPNPHTCKTCGQRVHMVKELT